MLCLCLAMLEDVVAAAKYFAFRPGKCAGLQLWTRLRSGLSSNREHNYAEIQNYGPAQARIAPKRAH